MNTFAFDKNEFLTQTVNFGRGSAFYKGSGFAFMKILVWARARFIKYADSPFPRLFKFLILFITAFLFETVQKVFTPKK